MIAGSVVLWGLVLVGTIAAAVFAVLYVAVAIMRAAKDYNPWGQAFMAILLATLIVIGVMLLTGVIGS